MSLASFLQAFLSPRSKRRKLVGLADSSEHYPAEFEESTMPHNAVVIPKSRNPSPSAKALVTPLDEVLEPDINNDV
jgi:hypothetical protein